MYRDVIIGGVKLRLHLLDHCLAITAFDQERIPAKYIARDHGLHVLSGGTDPFGQL